MNEPTIQPTDRSNEQKNYESNPSIVCRMLYAERSKYSNLKGAFREVKCIPNSKNSYEYESVSAFYVYFRCEIFGPLHVFFVCLIEDVHLFTCFPRPSLVNASIRSSDSPQNSVFLFTFMLSSIIGFFCFFSNKANEHVWVWLYARNLTFMYFYGVFSWLKWNGDQNLLITMPLKSIYLDWIIFSLFSSVRCWTSVAFYWCVFFGRVWISDEFRFSIFFLLIFTLSSLRLSSFPLSLAPLLFLTIYSLFHSPALPVTLFPLSASQRFAYRIAWHYHCAIHFTENHRLFGETRLRMNVCVCVSDGSFLLLFLL